MRVEIRSKGDTVPSDAAMSAFCDPIREAVAARRSSGMSRAIYDVARFFGLSERRVKAAVYGEIRQVLAAELLQVQQRMLEHLEAEDRRLEAQRALIAARRAALIESRAA